MSQASAHLHVHSEYSLLDGAANIDGLAARAAAFGQPALGLTDHGVMNGSVELYKACKKHDIKPILGLEAYFVDDRTVREGKIERNHLTLLAASDEGFKNLTKLSSAGFLEGLYRGKPGVDLHLLERHAEGVIALTRLPRLAQLPPHRRGPRRPGARPPRRARPDLRPRGRLLRGPAQRHRRAGAGQRADPEVRAGDGPPARRDRRRALPPQGGLPPPRRAAVRADEVDARPAEDELRHQRVLFEELGGDGGVVQRHAGGARQHARDRRALRHHDRAQAAADPALRHAQRRVGGGVPPHARRRRACASATATRSPPPPASAPTWSSPSSATWASTPTS